MFLFLFFGGHPVGFIIALAVLLSLQSLPISALGIPLCQNIHAWIRLDDGSHLLVSEIGMNEAMSGPSR